MILKRAEARAQLRASFLKTDTRVEGRRVSRGAMFRTAWAAVARPTPSEGPNRKRRRYVASYRRRGLKTPEEVYQEGLEKLKLVPA